MKNTITEIIILRYSINLSMYMTNKHMFVIFLSVEIVENYSEHGMFL